MHPLTDRDDLIVWNTIKENSLDAYRRDKALSPPDQKSPIPKALIRMK